MSRSGTCIFLIVATAMPAIRSWTYVRANDAKSTPFAANEGRLATGSERMAMRPPASTDTMRTFGVVASDPVMTS